MRVEVDDSNESLGKKIRGAELRKIPYMLVVGDKEAAEGTVAARNYKTKEQETMRFEEFEQKLLQEIKERAL